MERGLMSISVFIRCPRDNLTMCSKGRVKGI